MKKGLFSLTIILLLALPLFGLTDWEKAVKTYADNSDLKPYRMSIYTETFNGKGKLEKQEESEYRLSYDTNGETKQELLRATEDGKDITEEKKIELEKNGGRPGGGDSRGGGNMEGMDKHPFDPDVQDDVTAFDTGKREYRSGIKCSVWDFNIALNDKYSGIGTAWIDEAAGEAVSISYQIEPLFPFVEEMNLQMDFKSDSEDFWVMDKLKMSGTVNMIIMKKRFDSVTSFSDYR